MVNIPSFKDVQYLIDTHISAIPDFYEPEIVGSGDFYDALVALLQKETS